MSEFKYLDIIQECEIKEGRYDYSKLQFFQKTE
jgi:hypothetical protein